jgi:hypothetical protein
MVYHIDWGIDMVAKQAYFIIGGGTLQYNFVSMVKEMGFTDHVFDYDPYCRCAGIADYFHLISIDEKEKILETAKNIIRLPYRPLQQNLEILPLVILARKWDYVQIPIPH